MINWYARLLKWLGFPEPKAVVRERKLDIAVRRRKAACIRLDRAIKDVNLAAQKK